MFLIIQFFRLHVVDSSKLTKRRNRLCTTQERDHILLRMAMLIRVIMHVNPLLLSSSSKTEPSRWYFHASIILREINVRRWRLSLPRPVEFTSCAMHRRCRPWQTLSPPWRPTNLYYWIADCSSSSPVFNTWTTETWNLISRSLPYIVLLSLLHSMATFPA